MASKSTIAQFIAADNYLPTDVSRLVRGDHGIGKSAIIKQIATARGLKVIDKRLSQMTEGDLVGLPFKDDRNGTTVYLPPDWVKEACDQPRLVFLDELNRSTQEVMQGAFQLCLDRELNGNVLHPDSMVYAAINSHHRYQTNDMDPALLDRFAVFNLDPTVPEWVAHARSLGFEEGLLDFFGRHPEFLDPPKAYSPGETVPSRRSWTRWHESMTKRHSGGRRLFDAPDTDTFFQVSCSFVGDAATTRIQNHLKADSPVTPEQILEKYGDLESGVRNKCRKMSDERHVAMIDAFAQWVHSTKRTKLEGQWPWEFCEQEEKAIQEALGSIDADIYQLVGPGKLIPLSEVNNFSLWVRDLPKSLRVYMWMEMIKSVNVEGLEPKEAKEAKQAMVVSFHWGIREAMTMAYGVRSGKRGVGQRPVMIAMHGVPVEGSSLAVSRGYLVVAW